MSWNPRWSRRPSHVPVAALALAVFLSAGSSAFAKPNLSEGTWVSVKGRYVDGGIFLADSIEALDDDSASVKGTIEEIVHARGEIRIGNLFFALSPETRVQDEEGESLPVDRLETGKRVKIALEIDNGNAPKIDRVRVLPGTPSDRLRLEGPLDSGLIRRGSSSYFDLLGVEVRATSRTDWDGIPRPVIEVDDEDYRPGRGIAVGGLGRLSGEVRFDLKGESNFDLADQLDSDFESRRNRVRLEWTFPQWRRVSAMLQIKSQREDEITDERDTFDETGTDLTLGRAYVMLHGVLGKRGSLQVGRSRFDDRRDWLFNRDVDALRAFFYFERFHVEASVSQELFDPTVRHEDVLNTLLRVTAHPGRRHSVSTYLFDRDDRFRRANGAPRDFSPQLIGLSAEGEGRFLQYWLEAAVARGSIEGEPLRGRAFDTGVTFVGPSRVRPSLTLGYAYGSGDDDPFDGVSRTFRQSGLHANNGKWNGVSSFHYYGELTDPELANLHVQTYGIGLRPLKRTSVDLVFHRYKLDTPATEWVDSDVEDRRLDLLRTDVGREWDLVFGFEQLRHWEFEIDLGYYEPGEAILGPDDPAFLASLKVKFIF